MKLRQTTRSGRKHFSTPKSHYLAEEQSGLLRVWFTVCHQISQNYIAPNLVGLLTAKIDLDSSHQQNRLKIGIHAQEGLGNLTRRISTLKNFPKGLYKLLLAFFLYLLTFGLYTFRFFPQNINNIIVII